MPAKVTKLPTGRYRVSTPSAVYAKGTTKTEAKSQQRLLNALDHGFQPRAGLLSTPAKRK